MFIDFVINFKESALSTQPSICIGSSFNNHKNIEDRRALITYLSYVLPSKATFEGLSAHLPRLDPSEMDNSLDQHNAELKWD